MIQQDVEAVHVTLFMFTWKLLNVNVCLKMFKVGFKDMYESELTSPWSRDQS